MWFLWGLSWGCVGFLSATLSPGVGRGFWLRTGIGELLRLTSMRSLSTSLRRAISECLSTASHSPTPNIIVPSTCKRHRKQSGKYMFFYMYCVQVNVLYAIMHWDKKLGDLGHKRRGFL